MRQRFRSFMAQMRLSYVSAIQYRTDYVLTVLSVGISTVVEVLLWRLVIRDEGSVQGFTLPDLMVYLVIANITAMLGVSWDTVLNFSEEIRSGKISRHLLKPISLFSVTTGNWLATNIPVYLGSIPVFIGLHFVQPGIFHPGLIQAGMYLVLLMLAVWLAAEIYFMILLTAFWISENEGVAIAFNVLRWAFIGSAFPISFYPEWLVRALDATPLPYMAYYPTIAFMGKLPLDAFPAKMATALAMAITISLARRLAWRMAERRLQTVGG